MSFEPCAVIVASCPVVVPVESLHSCSCNCELVLFCGSSMPPFEKKCPECGNTVHVRKLSCSCGYGFSRTSKRCLTSKNSIKQSVEANDKRKKANVACQTRKRALLTYQESQQCRQTNASCMALKRSLDIEKESEKHRQSDSSRHAHKRALETDHESEKRRQADASRHAHCGGNVMLPSNLVQCLSSLPPDLQSCPLLTPRD